MNIELAQKVLNHIKTHPESFDLHEGMTIDPTIGTKYRPNFPCGTVACIAGWTVLLHDFENETKTKVADFICSQDWSSVQTRAQELLEIDNRTVERLFYLTSIDFSIEENNEIAIARFESFIEQERLKVER